MARRPWRQPRRLAVSGLFGVFEEAFACLTAEVSVLDELAKDLGRVVALALAMAILHRAIEDVEAAEVEQVEWTHGPVEALLHGGVDVLRACVAALEEAHGFFGCGEQDAVDDEAPDFFLDQDWSSVDAADEFHRCFDGLVGRFRAFYHLA